MIVTVLLLLILIAFAAALAWPALPPVRRRRLERADRELAARRIAELSRLAELEPDAIPRAPDLTRGQRRRLKYRRHPIARKRSGRPI